ncbi:IclR family transcriptional regulator [Thalassospira mesophila]|uniref:IclR family transcriptional regulator n=1 Tax=Thalassospira mesophila TaxID=1293891 RepID=A0A1Y2KVD3_9PROT|nr:IclR family transcriptional regulator [Thalassospira mesophila]OSQ35776.1 IclR family transcriptional regulator [Thalassospira mesophila]
MTTQLNGSVLKAFRILELFAAGRSEMSAGEVAKELKINLITAHRFLHTLEQAGALRVTARGVFRLGYMFADLGERVLRDGGPALALQPVLDDLARATGEACMATRFENDMAVCIAKALPGRSLYVDIRIGTKLDAFCTAHGKLWLAFMEDEKRDTYLATAHLSALTATTITGKSALKQELQRIREDGFALNDGERESDIYAIAVPVTNRTDRMVSALSTFGTAREIVHQRRARLLRHLQDAALAAQSALYGGSAGT